MKRGKPLRRGKPLQRGASLKRGKRLKFMSDKRRALLPARADCVDAVSRRSGGWCEAQDTLHPGVRRRAVDVHEVQKRSRNREAWLNPALCLHLCRSCHDFTELHPQDATVLGLLQHSWDHHA